MANVKPLVHVAGQTQRIQAADDLDLSVNVLNVESIAATGNIATSAGDVSGVNLTASALLTAADALITDDLSVVDDAAVGGDMQVTGATTSHGLRELKAITNDHGSTIVIGEAVYISDNDEVKKAIASAEATTLVAGLVHTASIDNGDPGDIQTTGTVVATTGQWDAVTGESGGLVAGALYYLSSTTAGRITRFPPERAVIVGIALDTTDLLLFINTRPGTIKLTANTTIYVATTGDDVEGDGSSGNPYLTIHRAADHYTQLNPGRFLITVNLGEGIHDVDEIFSTAYPYAGQLAWVGQYESVATPTISAIDASVTGGSAPYANLEFLDFDLDLAAASTSPVVGQFVRLTGCTGGTNPDGLNGLHEIVAVASDVATCRVWRRAGTTELPSGAITVASVIFLKTVLHFTADDHGIDMKGPIDMGNWDGVVLRGNDDAVGSSKRAIRLFNGAGIRGATLTGNTAGLYVYEWAVAYEVVGGSTAYLLRSGTSKITSTGMSSDANGTILATGASTWNGIVGVTLQASNNSTIVATSGVIQGVNTAGAGVPVLSQTGGFVNVASARIHYDQGAGTAILARDMGRVHEEGATIVGFTTDYSPTADTFGNGGAYINTA